MGVECDLRDRPFGPPQLPSGPLEQQPPPHGGGRLLDDRAEHTEELRSAAIGTTGQLLGARVVFQRAEHHLRQPFGLVHSAHGFYVEGIVLMASGPRLIIRLFLSRRGKMVSASALAVDRTASDRIRSSLQERPTS